MPDRENKEALRHEMFEDVSGCMTMASILLAKESGEEDHRVGFVDVSVIRINGKTHEELPFQPNEMTPEERDYKWDQWVDETSRMAIRLLARCAMYEGEQFAPYISRLLIREAALGGKEDKT